MPPPLLTRRRDIAAPLSAEQFDANVDNFDERITVLEEADPPEAVSVDDVDLVGGDTLVVTLTDATTRSVDLNPLLELLGYMPVIWAPDIPLIKNNVFPINGSLWVTIYPHTTEATFDAGANDGLGHNYYFELLPNPGNSFDDGGLVGQVPVKQSTADFDHAWAFLDAQYVTFTPSTASSLTAEDVAEALEELEGLITSGIGDALAALTAEDISFEPSTASGLSASTVGSAIEEIAARTVGFDDLTGTIDVTQRDPTITNPGSISGANNVDANLGSVYKFIPTGATTLNATSAGNCAVLHIIIVTSGTSSYNITFGSNFKSEGVLATGTVSGKVFVVTFVGDGVNMNEVSRTAAM